MARALGRSSEVRSRHSDVSTAMYDAPLNRNAQPVPTAAIRRPADRGADHARAVERSGVQPDRVREVSFADQLGDEGLAHRRIERGTAAEQEGEHIDVPELLPGPVTVSRPRISESAPIVACVAINSLRWLK